MANKKIAGAIFLDLKKAFDIVNILRLYQLKTIGVAASTYDWFFCYLSGRTQCVHLNGCFSDPMKIEYDVSQGSI